MSRLQWLASAWKCHASTLLSLRSLKNAQRSHEPVLIAVQDLQSHYKVALHIWIITFLNWEQNEPGVRWEQLKQPRNLQWRFVYFQIIRSVLSGNEYYCINTYGSNVVRCEEIIRKLSPLSKLVTLNIRAVRKNVKITSGVRGSPVTN